MKGFYRSLVQVHDIPVDIIGFLWKAHGSDKSIILCQHSFIQIIEKRTNPNIVEDVLLLRKWMLSSDTHMYIQEL